jgi:signal transduction histidine kinase
VVQSATPARPRHLTLPRKPLHAAEPARYVMPMNSDEKLAEFVNLVRRVRHDANNPITAALGHVQLLLEEPVAQDPEVRESLEVVESELRRLIEILRRLNEVRTD